MRNPDIRKHVLYKQYMLGIPARTENRTRGWGHERVLRLADLLALSLFLRFMDPTGHAADLWPVDV